MPNMPQTYTARAFRIWHAGKVRDKPEYLRSCQPAVGRQQVGVGGRLGDCFVFLAGRAQPLASKIVMRVHRRRRARLSCQKSTYACGHQRMHANSAQRAATSW
jgi:hypothetical protein